MNQISGSKLQTILINLFILLSTWVMITTNLNLQAPKFYPSLYPPNNPDHIISKINWYLDRFHWSINRIGWIVGLKNYWRMFSPVDRFNWYMIFTAVYQNGQEEKLPLPHQTPRSSLQRNFTDYREAKFFLNIYLNKSAQSYYADYLCRSFQDSNNPINWIKINLRSQNILSPQTAKRRGIFLESRIDSRDWGSYKCQH